MYINNIKLIEYFKGFIVWQCVRVCTVIVHFACWLRVVLALGYKLFPQLLVWDLVTCSVCLRAESQTSGGRVKGGFYNVLGSGN